MGPSRGGPSESPQGRGDREETKYDQGGEGCSGNGRDEIVLLGRIEGIEHPFEDDGRRFSSSLKVCSFPSTQDPFPS